MLYKEKNTVNTEYINYKHIIDKLPKLNEEEKGSVEREINIEDLKYIVYKSKNNKSPGPDGFSNEFYKIFWDQIQNLLLQLMNHYRKKGELNKQQISGIITCIPKGGKMRNDLQNWRPITLLDSIYNNNNNNNNWNLYSAFSIHKMFKSAAHCHSLSNSPQRLNGRA